MDTLEHRELSSGGSVSCVGGSARSAAASARPNCTPDHLMAFSMPNNLFKNKGIRFNASIESNLGSKWNNRTENYPLQDQNGITFRKVD